jgi:predicted amidohydrolase YtcJ
MISFNSLDIFNSSVEGSSNYMSEDYLRACSKLVASHGFCIRFTPTDRKAVLAALDIAGELSESYPKQAFSVRHEEEFTDEELSEVYSGNAAVFDSKSKSWEGAAEEINKRTLEAAHAMGKGRLLGSIENGKAADFAVFDKDPFLAATKEEFDALRASKIIIAGNISEL